MCEIVFHNGEIVRDDKSIKMGGIYYLKRNRDIVKGRSNDIEKLSSPSNKHHSSAVSRGLNGGRKR